MSTWRPASREDVEAIVDDQLRECSDAQRALFERIRIPTAAQPIERSGERESVFAVARIGDELLFWEDVEEGFELAAPGEGGVLRRFGASQRDLSQALQQLMDERD